MREHVTSRQSHGRRGVQTLAHPLSIEIDGLEAQRRRRRNPNATKPAAATTP